MGLLSGLGGFGLGDLEGMDLYESPDKPENEENKAKEEAKPVEKTINEADYLLERSFTCPVCDKEFKSLAVKAGKSRLMGTEKDLRPKYDSVEPLKYEVIMCPTCGYAALKKYWGNVTDQQRKNLREKIGASFIPVKYTNPVYSYDEAFVRFQMALAGSIVKKAKTSERAYICLKTGWLLEAQEESMDPESEEFRSVKKELDEKEGEYLKNALDGLIAARQSETFPICDMDENTLDYLIAALSVRFGKYEQAARLVSHLLTSKTASTRIKDKSRELKEEILIKLKQK